MKYVEPFLKNIILRTSPDARFLSMQPNYPFLERNYLKLATHCPYFCPIISDIINNEKDHASLKTLCADLPDNLCPIS